MRIIHRALCLVFPGVIGAGVVRKNPDDMDVIDVLNAVPVGEISSPPKTRCKRWVISRSFVFKQMALGAI